MVEKSDEPLVSVVIPTYNRETTIEGSVSSVLSQGYRNLEVIVVDDCSTDGTLNKLIKISDSRLHIIKLKKNSGACAARNEGIRCSHGRFIAFNDSDDLFRKDKIEKQLSIALSTDADIVFCQMQRHNYKDRDGIFPNLEGGFVNPATLANRSKCSTQTILAKKEVFARIMFDENMPRMQDYDFVLSAVNYFTFYFIQEPLVDVYLQKDSITSSKLNKLLEVEQMLYEKHASLFRTYPQLRINLVESIAYFKTRIGLDARNDYFLLKSICPSTKNKVKYLMSIMGILPIYFNIKK